MVLYSPLQSSFELENLSNSRKSSRSGSPFGEVFGSSPALPLDASHNPHHHPQTLKGKIIRIFKLVWNGPAHPSDEPTPWRIFSRLDALPSAVQQRLPSWLWLVVVALYFLCWTLMLRGILFPHLTEAPWYPSSTGERTPVVSLSCGQARDFWRGKNTACGMDGTRCLPFHESDVIFRCPALCDRESFTFSSIPVGDTTVKYRGFFVGGGKLSKVESTQGNYLTEPYRADSYPCGAATHAGVVSPFWGGCARITYTGPQAQFPAAVGRYGVSPSIGTKAFFPSSYRFRALGTPVGSCSDPRLMVLLLNVLMGIPVVFFLPVVVSFWTLFTVSFWTVILSLDPPQVIDPSQPEMLASVVSLGLERFLPSCFIVYALWRVAVRFTLGSEGLKPPPPTLRTLLWYPTLWLGVCSNLTFDRLPVDRLTWKDLSAQPGGLMAVTGIFSVIVFGICVQAYQLWRAGMFKQYLALYTAFVLALVVLAHLPDLTLRIHHYILGMLLIPGTRTRGVQALVFQGILLGLFINGASRWGLASIAETDTHLRRDDPDGRVSPPAFTGFSNHTGLLSWHPTAQRVNGTMAVVEGRFDAYTLMINDIQRYEGPHHTVNVSALIEGNESLRALVRDSLVTNPEGDGNLTLYLRVARAVSGRHKYSAFTQAAVLKWPSGEFIASPQGLT